MKICDTEIDIPCGSGSLEGRLLYGKEQSSRQGVIICPPHPLLAGNLENNVVQAIAATMAPHMPVLLFNYRGVGKSWSPRPELPLYEYWQGLDNDNGYTEIINDLNLVIQWSTRCFTSCHLIGYSFGSYIALNAFAKTILSLTAVTPPVTNHDFSKLETVAYPALVILAENDNLLNSVEGELQSLGSNQRTVRDSDHFFRRKELDVSALVREFILGEKTMDSCDQCEK
ncbi:alpha/beta hydrolase [Desulforhopalus singaporensis]|uniref:AB hydrolase-1 domain-containing protein n=1 Tax=Desulforhopalus singaporensis TaxID=91360 RepID=A0A1H0PTN5_9BACT|nr:hypothetical protein [Desulforhopalus singaporensis]SDP08527.1 hypothetical protein SAMN05660330_01762 [Desulforhopalus singaporensis]